MLQIMMFLVSNCCKSFRVIGGGALEDPKSKASFQLLPQTCEARGVSTL